MRNGKPADHRVGFGKARLRVEARGPPPSWSDCANSAGSKAHRTIDYRWAEGRNNRYGEAVVELSGARSMSSSRKELRRCNPRHEAGDIGHSRWCFHRERPGCQGLVANTRAAGRKRHRPDRTSRPSWSASGIELLREVIPALRRLADPGQCRNPRRVLEIGQIHVAARTLGVEVVDMTEIRRAADIAPAFETLKDGAQVLYVAATRLTITQTTSPSWRSAHDCRQCMRIASRRWRGFISLWRQPTRPAPASRRVSSIRNSAR